MIQGSKEGISSTQNDIGIKIKNRHKTKTKFKKIKIEKN